MFVLCLRNNRIFFVLNKNKMKLYFIEHKVPITNSRQPNYVVLHYLIIKIRYKNI